MIALLHKQKQQRNRNNAKLALSKKFCACIFGQKHSDTKLGLVISPKKIKQVTKYSEN